MSEKKLLNFNYLAIVLIIVKSMLHYSTIITLPGFFESLIELFAYSIWGISLIRSKYDKKYFLLILLCVCICLYTSYVCKNFIIFSSFMFFCLCMSKSVNEKKIINIIYKTVLAVLVVHFFAFILQYLDGSVLKISDNSGRVRFSLGFTNPNIVSYYTLWCFLGYIFCNFQNINKVVKLFIPLFLVLVVYLFTKSNTLIYMVVLSILILKIKIPVKLLKKITKYSVLIITILWILCIQLYSDGNKLAININEKLNYRLYYSYEAKRYYGYTMFGKKINMDVGLTREKSYMSTSLILDVTYTILLCKYGIIYIFMLYQISKIISDCNDDLKKKYLIIWSIFAISETASLNFAICFPPVFAAFLLQNKK